MSANIHIVPTNTIPLPYEMDEDQRESSDASALEELAVAGNTAALKDALGAKIFYPNDEDAHAEAALLNSFLKSGKNKNLLKRPGVALAANGFLKTYGHELGMEVGVTRAAIKNKLFEIANCGDPRFELKALELLGKTSDISLFTERSEININYNNSADLEKAIRERVKRLLNASVVETIPLSIEELDDVLGVFDAGEDAGEASVGEEPVETEDITPTLEEAERQLKDAELLKSKMPDSWGKSDV